jgi:hypothetical protein
MHVACKLIDFELQRRAYNVQWGINFLSLSLLPIFFFIVDKMMYVCSNCFYVVTGTSSCLFAMLFLLLKYLEIFLVSQPSPMLSVILLIVDMFPSEN